jgi:hypothetical protein
MLKKFFSICAAIMIVASSSYADTKEKGAWSEAVNGVQGRIIIPENQFSNDKTIVAVYLELRNVSNISGPIEIYFDPIHTFQCQLISTNGKSLAPTMLPGSVFVPNPFWLVLPDESLLRFRISINGYGMPKNARALIPLTCGDWLIESNDVNDYELEVTFTVKPPKVDRYVWQGTIKLPKVKIPR